MDASGAQRNEFNQPLYKSERPILRPGGFSLLSASRCIGTRRSCQSRRDVPNGDGASLLHYYRASPQIKHINHADLAAWGVLVDLAPSGDATFNQNWWSAAFNLLQISCKVVGDDC